MAKDVGMSEGRFTQKTVPHREALMKIVEVHFFLYMFQNFFQCYLQLYIQCYVESATMFNASVVGLLKIQ